MPRKNLKPYVIYAEMNREMPGVLYDVDRFYERKVADDQASILRRSWECRIVEVHEVYDYPVPFSRMAGNGCPKMGAL